MIDNSESIDALTEAIYSLADKLNGVSIEIYNLHAEIASLKIAVRDLKRENE